MRKLKINSTSKSTKVYHNIFGVLTYNCCYAFRRLKLGADLEALIGQYDSEMFARQEVLDQLLLDEQANKDELTAIEKRLQKVEMRYNVMQEEDRLREAAEVS